MARRKNKLDLRLNDSELDRLNKDVQKTGWSREKYLRALISNAQINAKPPVDLVLVLKELQQISNSMNQIALKTSTLNFVDTDAYWRNIDELKSTIRKLLEVMYG